MNNNLFKLTLSLLLLLVASFSFGQNPKEIVFEKKVHRFKKVDEGKVLTFKYIFNYTGKYPLTILPPKVDCSCTEVLLPKQPILPNTSDTVTVIFNTKDKMDYQVRDVKLHFISDLMDSTYIEKKITFKGMVKATEATKAIYENHK